jgi:hypothetical protein
MPPPKQSFGTHFRFDRSSVHSAQETQMKLLLSLKLKDSVFHTRFIPVYIVATMLAIYGLLSTQALLYFHSKGGESSKIYGRDTSHFPVIYVGQGLLDCGAPLVTDQCSTYPLNYSISTGQQTFSIHASYLFSVNTTYSILSNNATVTLPIDGHLALSGTFQVTITPTPPATRVALETSYTPTISPAAAASANLLPRASPYPTNIPRNNQPLKRSYDYNICQGGPPDHRLLTRSLVEVCHFVANAKNYFVSLRPNTDAVYLPSWPGYLIQTVLCFMYFFCIVKPTPTIKLIIESSLLPKLRSKTVPQLYRR